MALTIYQRHLLRLSISVIIEWKFATGGRILVQQQ